MLTSSSVAFAQRASDWMTSSNDAQRSSWVRSDAKISLESMRKPGFGLVWKMPLERGQAQLTSPALLDFYIGYRGFRTFGFFGSVANRVIAVDTDLARVEWEKSFGPPGPATGTAECPGGMTSSVTRPTSTQYPLVFAAGGFGRSGYAKSGVGKPYEGAVTLKTASAVRAAPRPAPARARAGAEPFNPFAPHVQYVVALSGDGKLHLLWVSNGNEERNALPFIPPNAHARGLMVFDNTAYIATTGNCGGVENGIWALNLTSGKVAHWKTSAESIAGNAGFAAGPDGTIYTAAGSELVALAPKTLEPRAIYKTDGPPFTSTPVIFPFNGKDLIAATTSDGRLHLLDAAALGSGKPVDRSDSVLGHDYAAGGLATWQDNMGDRWILVPVSAGASSHGYHANGPVTNGAIAAWKVEAKNGEAQLEPAWISRDMVSPLSPIVVDDVIFALSAGKSGSANAILYALDPATGKEIWTSGSTIASYAAAGGLAAGGTRVYVATQDGIQYAFGYPIEH
jgi:outer membrane protein assembly factor BamB